jgi:hypothetical protein
MTRDDVTLLDDFIRVLEGEDVLRIPMQVRLSVRKRRTIRVCDVRDTKRGAERAIRVAQETNTVAEDFVSLVERTVQEYKTRAAEPESKPRMRDHEASLAAPEREAAASKTYDIKNFRMMTGETRMPMSTEGLIDLLQKAEANIREFMSEFTASAHLHAHDQLAEALDDVRAAVEDAMHLMVLDSEEA